jgi:hypothetical protein
MATDSKQGTNGQLSRKGPENVASTTRVTVAFPFSQVKIHEPSCQLVELAALVTDLAELVAQAVPGPQAQRLQHRAHDLAGQLR